MQLNKIQKNFKKLMLDHPDALENPPKDFADIFEEKHIPLAKRLKVYRNNIVGSLSEVIIASFPIIENLVGKEFMENMARHYVIQNPPTEGCLNQYGTTLPNFIKTFEPAKSLPYLADIARLEIAMNDAYYAKDHETLTAEDFGKILPEHLPETIIKIGSSVQLITFDYPVTTIRDYCLSDDQEQTLDISTGEEILLIHRPELEVFITPIAEDEYAMLENLKQHNLGDAVEITLLQYPDFDFQPFLQKHLDIKTFSTLK